MSQEKKKLQLGMNPSTAQHRLRKDLMFFLAQKCNMDVCHQCGEKIETAKELSIEHKTPWLDSEKPIETFFDIENIAFSHLACNISAARRYQTSAEDKLQKKSASYKKYYTAEKRRERYQRTGN